MEIQPAPDEKYYAVIFSSTRTAGEDGYAEMADAMQALAHSQPGCLGSESFRDADAFAAHHAAAHTVAYQARGLTRLQQHWPLATLPPLAAGSPAANVRAWASTVRGS